MTNWSTARVEPDYDLLAPDGSEIRLLVATAGGSMVHCSLRPGQVSRAVQHRTVEEMWFCVSGRGQMWRKAGAQADVLDLEPGVALSIPLGTAFQFRATGERALAVVIVTIPSWPGQEEALPVRGAWPPTAP